MIFSDFYREIREFDAELAPGSETPLWSEFVAWSREAVALEDEDSLCVDEADRDFWHSAYDLLGQQADDIESGWEASDALTIDELLSQVS